MNNLALRLNIGVSQSGNNRATIENSTMDSEDLTDDRNVSSWVLDIKIPDVTNITSVTQLLVTLRLTE